MSGPKYTAKDIKGVVVFPPTPVKEGANTWSNKDAINYDEAAKMTEMLIKEDIVCAIALNGTFGELSAITWEEKKKLTSVVWEVAKGKMPVFAGATTMNVRDTIEQARAYRDMGLPGILLGRPVIPLMTAPGIVQFYKDVAEAVPDMNIMLYDDMEQFKGPIPSGAYAELAKMPQIIACKYRDRSVLSNLMTNTLLQDYKAVKGHIKLLQIETDWYYHSRMFEDDEDMNAFWSVAMVCAPNVIKAMYKAIAAKDWKMAKEASDDLAWCYELLFPEGKIDEWPLIKIALLKAWITECGLVNPGPPLPPYHVVPERFEVPAKAKEMGRRCREANAKWASKVK